MRSLIWQDKQLVKSQMAAESTYRKKKEEMDFFFMSHLMTQPPDECKRTVIKKPPPKVDQNSKPSKYMDRGVLFMKRLEDEGANIKINRLDRDTI